MSAALVAVGLALLVAPASATRKRLQPSDSGLRLGTGWRAPARVGVRAVSVAVAVLAVLAGPGVGIAGAVTVGTVAYRLRRRGRARRRDREQRALLAGLEVVVAELRVGAHPAVACTAAAEEVKDAVAESFRGAAATAGLGGSAAEGLVAGAGRRGRDGDAIARDVHRVAAAWRIAERHGIALADLLDAARSDLLARLRFRSRVESGMAGARATAAVLAGLPLLGVALGQMMGAAPLRVLLGGGIGGVLLVVGTGLACAGLLWTDHITQRVTA
ncbi:type II secretion system F family protein [Rhodococcus sp. NPDC003318]|uniref:type II secretion system F family protein n=1 Tax=Rhodococcus sp. NPDC003318 TaxID=3364503 RepID=UPI0036BC5DFA